MQHPPPNSVEKLVRSASQRRHRLLALEQTNYSLVIVLGGAILLLLLGTQILDWYWLVLITLSGFGLGAFRFYQRRQPPYQIAQFLDSRLNLSDTLSTAWFVLTTPTPSNAPRQLQLRQAELVAARVQPRTTFPRPELRAWIPNALLFLVVFGLFSIRYLAYDHLDFRHTLLPLAFGSPAKTASPELKATKQRTPKSALHNKLELPSTAAGSPPQQNPSDKTEQATPQDKNELEQEAISAREARQPNDQENSDASRNRQDQQTRSPQTGDANNSPNEQGAPSPRALQPPTSPTNPSGSQDQQSAKENSAEEKSLTGKLRDVLSGLLAKMREGSAQQRGDAGGNKTRTANRDHNSAGANQNQQPNSGENDNKETQASSLPSQQSPQSTQAASNSPGKGSGNASAHQPSDARSAAGRQNGSKETREAEELKAMGKLEEIIGKRSASLSGEMTIDSPSGAQQLRTGYTNKTGPHSGIGSEIPHDEIPMEDQQYVREYMKQVHTQPNAR